MDIPGLQHFHLQQHLTTTLHHSTPSSYHLSYHHTLLTFEKGVEYSLCDPGLIDHIGSCLSEDQLPWLWFETTPVVLDD